MQGEVEVVCMSPNSGHLYTQIINIAGAAERSSELADRTSENSAIVRSEVREIYDQQSEEMSLREEKEENRDIEQYEKELHQVGRPGKERDKADDRRRTQLGGKDRRRSRSKKRRSRSNSNDRRRRSKQ